MNTITIVKGLGIAAALLLTSMSRPAHATVQTVPGCTVKYMRPMNERVMFACTSAPNTEYNAWGSGWTACNSRFNTDSFKIYSSMLQAALLSGKTITFNYDDAGDTSCWVSTNPVSLMTLNQ